MVMNSALPTSPLVTPKANPPRSFTAKTSSPIPSSKLNVSTPRYGTDLQTATDGAATDGLKFSSSGIAESAEVLEIVENSRENKKTYESDMVEMMRLSCERRFKWKANLDFFVAAISFLVGYDATFSFLRTFEGVGLTMIIPFSITLLCYGIPVLYLELALGQYSSLDPSLVFKRMTPVMAALGYMSWGIAFMSIVTSQGIMVLCLDLIVASINMVRDNYVFFETCHKYYNDEGCFELGAIKACHSDADLYYNGGCLLKNAVHQRQYDYILDNQLTQYLNRRKEPTYQYLVSFLIGFVDNKNPSDPSINTLVFTIVGWIIVAIIARKGIEFVVKISYITMTGLLVLVVMLFFCGLVVGGAWPGLAFFFELRTEHLIDVNVWIQTFTYVSTCLKLGQGGLITLGSYNGFHSNLFRNMVMIVLASFICPILMAFSLTPLYTAFLSKFLFTRTLDYEKFVTALDGFYDFEGVSTTASSLMLFRRNCAAFVLFFAVCVLFLCLGNQMMRITLLVNSLREHYHIFLDSFYMASMIALICALGCTVNLFFFSTYGGGVYYVLTTLCLPMICSGVGLFEVITIAYMYGSKKMFSNISAMLFGVKQQNRRRGMWQLVPYFNGYMMFCWSYLTPLVILTFLVLKVVRTMWYWGDWPEHYRLAHAFGFVLSFAAISIIPIDSIVRLCKAAYYKQPKMMLFQPHLMLWGPRKPKDRRLAQTQEERWRI